MKRFLLALALNAGVVLTMGTLATAQAGTPWLNVNIDTTPRIESLLEGPAGGLDTVWNQVLGGPGGIAGGLSASNLLDSEGEPTAVGFTTSAENLHDWGTPSLPLLASGAFQWNWDAPSEMVLSDLTPGYYDLFIASYHPNERGGGGVFTTNNPTSGGQTQIADNGGPSGNSSTWEQGVNYVLFQNMEPDVGGTITVTMVSSGPSNERRAYLSGLQLVRNEAPILSSAKDILTFVFPGLPEATVSVTSIALTAPYGTDVTVLAPTYTVSPMATAVPASGSTHNFTDPVIYTVTAEDGSTKDYTVTVSVTPIGTGKDILTFGLPGMPAAITGDQIAWPVPLGTDVTALAPDYTASPFATGAPPSGTTRNFSTPQTYTITAQDASTEIYTVTVIPRAVSPLINVNIDIESRTERLLVGPAGGLDTTWNQVLGSGGGVSASALQDSGGLVGTVSFTTNAGSLDPWYVDSPDEQLVFIAAAFQFGQGEPADLAIGGLTPGYYDLYIASGYPNEEGSQGSFTTANATSNGAEQTVDNGVRGGGGGNLSAWGQGVNYVLFHNVVPDATDAITVTFTGISGLARCMLSGFQLVWHDTATTFTGKDIQSFGLPGHPAVIAGTEIAWAVPFDADVTALQPTYTMSPMATGDPASGSTQDFTDPVEYTITAEDGTTQTYTVTVTVTPVSSAADIITFGLPGMPAVITGSEITWTVPEDTDVTNLAPEYTVSPLATEDWLYPSGTPRDFTFPVTYTITAEDGTTSVYTVTVTVQSEGTRFVRGDANTDGTTNIADAVYILQNLFANGPEIACPDAADSNDDEGVDIADAVYILQNLFAQGPDIPAPHPECGVEMTGHPQGGPDLPACSYGPELCNGQLEQ